MKPIVLITVFLCICSINTSAQIQLESLDLEVPSVPSKDNTFFSGSRPIMIVKIDSIEYQLDSLSYNSVDADWIKSVTVHKDSKTIEKYGYRGAEGVLIIQLKDDYIDDFLMGKKPSNPIILRKNITQPIDY